MLSKLINQTRKNSYEQIKEIFKNFKINNEIRTFDKIKEILEKSNDYNKKTYDDVINIINNNESQAVEKENKDA